MGADSSLPVHQAGSEGVASATPKPRVVFVDHIARLSGGEIALLRVLPALAADIEAHVVLGEDGPLVERLRERGVETEVLPFAERLRDVRKDSITWRRIDPRALVALPSSAFHLSRRIRELHADIVHTNSLKASVYGGAAARLARVPVVWHLRDRIAPDYLPVTAVALMRAAAWAIPSAIVTPSHSTLEVLPARLRNRTTTIVVPDVVEPRPPRPWREVDVMTVGMIGRLAPWKGQHLFLEAFAKAFAGSRVRGRIVGSALFGEHAYADSLVEQADRLGIAAQIEFRGFREDVWAELAELDMVVHCSLNPEPFGQVVLEAMAAGVPVIAAAAGGPSEIVRDGVSGILTSPGDVYALASALRRLAGDEDLRRRLADAGRLRSREFTPERAASDLLSLYRVILGNRRGTGTG